MPAVGISPIVAQVTQALLALKIRDEHDRWKNGASIFSRERITVSQFNKDIAYMTFHLTLPIDAGHNGKDRESEMNKILALIRNPVGTDLIQCPNCEGVAEVKVPNPNDRDSDLGGYRDMSVPCPSCDGKGWIPEK